MIDSSLRKVRLCFTRVKCDSSCHGRNGLPHLTTIGKLEGKQSGGRQIDEASTVSPSAGRRERTRESSVLLDVRLLERDMVAQADQPRA